METKTTPEVLYQVGEKEVGLRFDWKRLALLYERFKGQRLEEVMAEANPEKIALMLSIGSGGVVTKGEIMEASPPLLEAIQILDKALAQCLFGAKGAPQDQDGGEASEKN